MPNPLTLKLEQYTPFSPQERARIEAMTRSRCETYAPGQPIIHEGEKVDQIHLVLTGLAARSKQLPGGDRQIMAFLVPGDLCDVEVFVLDAMDHDIVAVGETTCGLIARSEIEVALGELSNLTKALWWSTMTDSAVLRARIIDHGRRAARERIAHLVYEMLVRYRIIGQARDNAFAFPVTQQDLADATGLTPVHVNRVLKGLRDDGLLAWDRKGVRVPDPARLKRVARFESAYLHLDRTEAGDDVAARAGDLV
ncbi:MAG TPA: Crp/Fnr family transcriptional regulator [Caulobacteraceae bacterium]|nr:Crp/Fnr family transcriptional regulator [Caulobacteraceae bacterium]